MVNLLVLRQEHLWNHAEEVITIHGLFVSSEENMPTSPWKLSSKIKKNMENVNTKNTIPQKQKIDRFISRQLEIVEKYKWDFKVKHFKMCIYRDTYNVSLPSSIYTVLISRSSPVIFKLSAVMNNPKISVAYKNKYDFSLRSFLQVDCRSVPWFPFTWGPRLKEQFPTGILKFSFQKEKSKVLDRSFDLKSSRREHTSLSCMLHWPKQVICLSHKTIGWVYNLPLGR